MYRSCSDWDCAPAGSCWCHWAMWSIHRAMWIVRCCRRCRSWLDRAPNWLWCRRLSCRLMRMWWFAGWWAVRRAAVWTLRQCYQRSSLDRQSHSKLSRRHIALLSVTCILVGDRSSLAGLWLAHRRAAGSVVGWSTIVWPAEALA